MADIFIKSSVEKNPNEVLCVVYVLYFDERRGQIPLLIYPNDKLRNNKKFMRPIQYHPVWFLETEELDHVDLEYNAYTFFGKKFLTKSDRKKRRAGLKKETPETIVIIVSLPVEIDIFGDDLIRKLTDEIRDNFEDQLYKVVESEIAGDIIIKTPKMQERIQNGKKIKVFIRELIDRTIKNYFATTITKKSDSSSLKTQKAISYFGLKGFEFSPLSSLKGEERFSNIELYDPKKKHIEEDLDARGLFSIKAISFIEDSQEIEVIIQNNKREELKNISISISHIKEFFEKEIRNELIDVWFPEEELLFISPILPHINEYLISINKQNDNDQNQKILTIRIDLKLIDKIVS